MPACLQPLPWLPPLLVGWALTLALADLRWRRVPNGLLLCGLALLLLALLLTPQACTPATLALVSGGALLGLLCWWPGYAAGQLGAGDVKCAMVMGLMLGLPQALAANLLGFLALGLMALVAVLRGQRAHRLPAVPALVAGFVAALAGWPGRMAGA